MFGGYSPPKNTSQPGTLQPHITAQRKTTRTGLCKICSKQFGSGGIINCHSCDAAFHHSCTGVTNQFYEHFIVTEGCAWYCHYCQTNLLKSSSSIAMQIEDAKKEIQKAVDTQFNTLQATIFTHKQETDYKLARLEESLKKEILTVKQSNSPSTSYEMQSRINFLEAQIKKRNLLINGVPTSENEDLQSVIVKISQACNVILPANSIEEIQRLKTNLKKGPPPGGSSNQQEGSTILVKFRTESEKNKLFEGYINRIKDKQFLRCSSIGYTSDRRIFVNHHLSPALRKVHDRALLLMKANVIEKVNSKSHAISVKIKEKWHSIITEEQLNQLISPQCDKN